MRFTIRAIHGQDRPDFVVELMAERLIERRLAHALPCLSVAMFRPVEAIPGAELMLAIHYQTRSIQEMAKSDWFTTRDLRGFSAERGWTSFRNLTSHRLDGVQIGGAQIVCEG